VLLQNAHQNRPPLPLALLLLHVRVRRSLYRGRIDSYVRDVFPRWKVTPWERKPGRCLRDAPASRRNVIWGSGGGGRRRPRYRRGCPLAGDRTALLPRNGAWFAVLSRRIELGSTINRIDRIDPPESEHAVARRRYSRLRCVSALSILVYRWSIFSTRETRALYELCLRR